MKRVVSMVLAVAILVGMLPTTAWATEMETVGGTCGENLSWTFDESSGSLKISGTGDMSDYSWSQMYDPTSEGSDIWVTDAPWRDYYNAIKSIDIESDVTSVGDGAFRGCSAVTSISLSNDVEALGEYSFVDCDGIIDIVIPENVKTIGEAAFSDCNALESVSILGAASIGNFAFSECANLISVELPETLTSIGEYGFRGCEALRTVTIPSSVRTIGTFAFVWCESLNEICFEGSAPSMDGTILSGLTCNVSYPSDDETWSKELQKEFDDTITWNGNSSDEGDSGSSHSHSYGDWYETKAPTQEAEGEERRDCINCDHYETRITEKLPVGEETGNSCGENLTWELDAATGTLVISGTGTMDNSWWPYETPSESPNFAPWHDNAANIKSVVINSGVTSIGHFAFFDCVNLSNVSIPEGVTFIGCAFVGCDSLKELNIPTSVTDFRYPSNEGVCTGLKKIVVDEGNSVYSSDESGMLYNKDKTKFIGCPTGYQGAYTIVNSVKTIGDWAFYACSGLTAVDIPTSVTSIGMSAFNSCTNLDGVVIPNGVTTIGMFTFAYCAGLTEITIPKNVTALGNGVFTECTALAEVRFEGDAPDIDYECFNQTSTTAYYPAGNSTWTEDKLSNYCGNIQWVGYADNVNQCGDELFWEFDAGTKTLTISGKGEMYDFPDAGSPWYSLNAEIDHVVISEGATSIGNYAFVSCGMDDIEIPDSVTRIGQGTFALSSIKSIKIPSGVTTIEEYTFTRSSLNSVVLPEQLKIIEENAFAETPLTAIALPDTLTEIGAEAFWSTMLTSVMIPENVTVIGDGAFAWCEELASFSVAENNVNFVAKKGVLFDKNGTTLIQYPVKKALETYTVPEGTSVIEAYAFSGAKALKKVVLSDNMHSLEKCAFIGCSGLTEMNVPENVSSFGLGLFDNCRNLKKITFTGDAPVFAEHWISEEMDLIAYYPADDETWTGEVKQNYGGKITWVVSCNHSFGDWYETKAPTEEAEGEERRDCEKCDHYETRTKEKLCQTHNYVSVITEPTCTEQGYTTYTCDCGYSYVDNYIEPLGHNMGEWYEYTKPTNEERGEDRRNCENCTYYESRSVPSLSTTLIDSGECGKDLQWRFTSDGVLSIVGTGSMRAWEPTVINPNGKAPWNKYTSEIRTLEIGSGVISIGSYAFYACKNLSVIKIPATLKAIGKNAFGSGARNLYITDLTAWCKIDFESRGSAPMQTYGGYLYINGEKTEELVIPDGITEIGNFSFSGMNFKSIKIPEGVSIIGGYAFAGNDRNMTLTSVELPESLRVIKGWAFSENRNLESISLPAKLSTIDENALCDTGISNITIPGSVNTISASAFSSCDNLESVVILDGVSSIEEEAFAFSDKLKDVAIPSSVTNIASDAFSYCKSLTKIELSNDNSSFTLKDGAVFSKNLGKLIIFPAKHNTSSFAIPDVTTTIADYAFQNSNNLKEVIIPDSITSIGTYAFSYSQNLASVTIPGTIEEIQYCTFAYSPGLIDVKIKSGIHTIGNWAFRECTNLRTVTIPRSVESIRDYAFYDCNSLSDVYYMGSEEEWGEIYIGSSNSCLLNANIHFNCEGPELEKNAEIRYFRKWDADTQTAYWGEEPPIVEGLDLGSQVTEETDTSFIANVDNLVGTYVLAETKTRDDGMIGPDILLSIKPVDTKIGTVASADENTIVIDGETYNTPDDLMFPDSYVGKTVRYYLYNGELISFEVSQSNDKVYDVVLNEYRDICSMTRDEYDSQYKESDYTYVNQLMMRYYHIYGDMQIVYAFYDIDNNGIAELLVGRGNEQRATIIGLYAFDGNAAVTLNNTAGERSSVKIYTDGTVFMGGALSASEYVSKYYRFDASGYKLTEVSAGSLTEFTNFDWKPLGESENSKYRFVLSPDAENLTVATGNTLDIECYLYYGEEIVSVWNEPQLSFGYTVGDEPVSDVLRYEGCRTCENGYVFTFQGIAIGTAGITLYDEDTKTKLQTTITVTSDIEGGDTVRGEWIKQHMEYAESDTYEADIIPGYQGLMYDEFKKIMDDSGIKFYDITNAVVNFLNANKEDFDQADMYEMLLAELMYSSNGKNAAEELYINNLAETILMYTKKLNDVLPKAGHEYDKIREKIEALHKLDKVDNVISDDFFEATQAIEDAFGDLDINGQLKEAASDLGWDLIFDSVTSVADTAGSVFKYMCYTKAYSATSDDFKNVMNALSYKVRRELGPEAFPELGDKAQQVNWSEFARACDSFVESLEKSEQDGMEEEIEAIIGEGISSFGLNAVKSIAMASVDFICELIPVVNLYPKLRAALTAGKSIVEMCTDIDEQSERLDLVTKLYCMAVALDSVTDDYANMLDEDYFWISTTFDESVSLYRTAMLKAIEYMDAYEYSLYQYEWCNAILMETKNEILAHYHTMIRALGAEKSRIESIECHDSNMSYDPTTDTIVTQYQDAPLYVVACPVDVIITAADGMQIAYLSNDSCNVAAGHEWYYRTITTESGEVLKVAMVPEGYNLSLKGTATGTMNVSVSSVIGNQEYDVQHFHSVPVSEGSVGYFVDNGSDGKKLIVDDNQQEEATGEYFHTYELSGFNWAEDHTCVATFGCISGDDTQTANCTVTSSTTPATETEAGKIVYTATVDFGGQTYTDTKTETIPATGHSTHQAGTKWISDGMQHWHKCTGCDEKLNLTDHSGGTATCTKKAVCSVCGVSYGNLADHEYETSWNQGDANGHWHECKNCSAHDAQVKHTPGATATEDTAQFCTVCGYVITPALGHSCTAGSKWYSNGTYHWHVCTSCGAWVKTSYHSYSSDTDEICNVCSYTRTVTATEPTQETEVAMTETTESTDPGEEVIAIETAPTTVPTEANENHSDDAVSEDTDSHGVSGVLITVFAIVTLGSLAALAILLVYKKRRKSE